MPTPFFGGATDNAYAMPSAIPDVTFGRMQSRAPKALPAQSMPTKADAASGPPNVTLGIDPSKTKARTRIWEAAFKRIGAAKTKDEAIDAIREIKPGAGLDGAACRRRRNLYDQGY